MKETYNYFLNNKLDENISLVTDDIVRKWICDNDYFNLLMLGNGGFFFGQSFQVYSLTTEEGFRSDENKDDDYCKIEIWPDSDMQREVLKKFLPQLK